jgi:hypothetical protein
VNPILAALVVIVILQMVALVVAVVARFWMLKTATFELHGIDVARATDLVAFYVQGVHDHRFGFPTGIFVVDTAKTTPGQVVAREVDVNGSAGYGPIKAGLMLPIAGLMGGLAMGDDGDGCGIALVAGMMGFALGCAAAVVVIVPCAFVTIVELLLRVLMRAEIRAVIEPLPDDAQSVQVHFELRGPSAFGIEGQLRRGMQAPHPAGALPAAPDPASAAKPVGLLDRLGALYLSAASVALVCSVVAIIAIGNAEHSPSGAVAASNPYQEPGSEPYETAEEEELYGTSTEEPAQEAEYESEGGYGENSGASTFTRYDAARRKLRRYWTLIDRSEYAAAYDIYYPTYATEEDVSKSDFVDSEHEYLPEIGLGQMTISRSDRNPTSPNEMWLYVEVPIHDTVGEFAGECRLFYGDVRMFHADGRWYYRPGPAFGRKPSFGQEGGGIRLLPDNSNRCS